MTVMMNANASVSASETNPESAEDRAQRVSARRMDRPHVDALQSDLQRAELIANLMDSRFQIGSVKVGLDALIGLIPVAGDVISAGVGLYPVYLAHKHKLGGWTVLKMLANVGADFAIGAVPVVGDAADVLFKAHAKNFKLLQAAASKKATARG
jgi:hypothetical protein